MYDRLKVLFLALSFGWSSSGSATEICAGDFSTIAGRDGLHRRLDVFPFKERDEIWEVLLQWDLSELFARALNGDAKLTSVEKKALLLLLKVENDGKLVKLASTRLYQVASKLRPTKLFEKLVKNGMKLEKPIPLEEIFPDSFRDFERIFLPRRYAKKMGVKLSELPPIPREEVGNMLVVRIRKLEDRRTTAAGLYKLSIENEIEKLRVLKQLVTNSSDIWDRELKRILNDPEYGRLKNWIFERAPGALRTGETLALFWGTWLLIDNAPEWAGHLMENTLIGRIIEEAGLEFSKQEEESLKETRQRGEEINRKIQESIENPNLELREDLRILRSKKQQ